MSLSRVFVAALIISGASPAQSAPPPPPKETNLKSLQSYVLGLNQGRPVAYERALAEDVKVIVGDQVAAKSKSEWMNSLLSRFTRGYNQGVTVEHIYYGGSQSSSGDFDSKAILIERVDRIFGDCCVFHRVETLTFRRDGLVTRIERSAELNIELKPDGHRQDELPATP